MKQQTQDVILVDGINRSQALARLREIKKEQEEIKSFLATIRTKTCD